MRDIKKLKKNILLIIGTISMVLGAIGIFLPILPTTPFLLFASFCYLRSSEKMYDYLMNHPIFGEYIYCYTYFRAIKKKTKIGAISLLWIAILLSVYFVPLIYVKALLCIIAIGVTVHISLLNTLTEDQLKEYEDMKRKTIEDCI